MIPTDFVTQDELGKGVPDSAVAMGSASRPAIAIDKADGETGHASKRKARFIGLSCVTSVYRQVLPQSNHSLGSVLANMAE